MYLVNGIIHDIRLTLSEIQSNGMRLC